jgi:8-amino-7-oxononanoate synthase
LTQQQRRLRSVSPVSNTVLEIDDRNVINFCSNDYLGISKHPKLVERAIAYAQNYGVGSTASRLVCGSYDCFHQVERKLASLKGAQGALILNSGYQANVSIIPALLDSGSLVLSDELNHNSIIQGISLAKCKKLLFRHNDIEHLEQLLVENQDKNYSSTLIATESVFSMDGDRCDIDALVELANRYQAILLVDEAHATGVLGDNGMGLTVNKGVDVVIGTFGKALGSFGAYVSCSQEIVDYLINCCGGFIYTTALPPSVIGSIDAALDLVPTMNDERQVLAENAEYLRASLHQLGYDTGNSTTQIIPVLIGDEKQTLELSQRMEQRGILATAIRPPTVPKGMSRIRLALSAAHTRDQIEHLIKVFR